MHTYLKWRYKPTSLVSGYKNSMRSKITTHHSIPPLDLCFSDLFAHIVFFRGEVKYYLRYCRQKWIFLIFGAKALGEVVFLVIVSDRWIMWFANLKIRNNWDATEFSHRMFSASFDYYVICWWPLGVHGFVTCLVLFPSGESIITPIFPCAFYHCSSVKWGGFSIFNQVSW